ncbi:winged helix-turn-helix domain-containing protein [Bradyrhizobium sp. NBAIM20]|uniref:winged helix-turn-helix domain-containing protein n=1 Tax=unclassified Bradyrhizobium TaxID=2631580 RepID=UPI001CD4F83F|nr:MULTISPECIES: winged helix-turn-helix domain-containing protein [unclassified Bradyrhizobium]MCA1412677.1 winged helix-turn-helix domain-containing protein [Bradyrhizobium sp. NBAIM20]MCA1463473.1 winged helix-turn-helix domain-containing protein [Bradyrhizobium sp. NBAIM18]
MRYFFEEYAFDTDLRELHRGSIPIPIAPQAFDLLQYLIRHRERVVSKDNLINAVWNGRIVSDAALTTRLNAARAAIGDDGDKQRLIKTLPRKGFRFVGAVQEMQKPATAPVSSAAQSDDTAQKPFSPPRLSIVVLPFANLGGDPEQDYFVDGVTENLTTDLSRIGGSFVIARNSAFSYKGKAIDVRQVGRELNVRYVLEGSVQRSGNRLRVNVQLVDAETGNHLWAERFDKPVADLFDMQDEIVSRLAHALRDQLNVAEARRAERSLHPDALDLIFQGRACFCRGNAPEHLTQASDFFNRSLAIDHHSIGALVGIALVDLTMGMSLLTDDRTARLSAAETNAVKALSLAPDHAGAHAILGGAYISTNRAAQGIAECERALALDRNQSTAHAQIGLAKYFLGRGAETVAHMNEAIRLSPRDNFAYSWLVVAGFAKLQLNADREAVDWFLRSIEANRNYPLAHFGLAAALALLGSLDQARAAAKAGLALNPSFTIRRFSEGASSDNATYLANRHRVADGMRIAGVPEA